MEPYRVLVVDDDEGIRKLLTRFLGRLGYTAEAAADTAEAIQRMESDPFDLVLTDVRMPGPDGIELLAWVRRSRPDTGVVILSGCDDIKLAVRAMRSGAIDYIVKPFEVQDVATTVGKAIAEMREARDRSRYLMELELRLEQQSGELRETWHQLQEANDDTLEALVSALDAREHETQAHSLRVTEYATNMAAQLGVSGGELDRIRRGSMLHDIGKIGVSDRILLKPETLTEEEWDEMRRHPQIGAWIVGGVESLSSARQVVIAHHERFDGSGYPGRVRGDQIPLGARVFAVADSLDAIVSDRPYRGRQSYDHAREEIERNSGTQFDPRVVECFLKTPPSIWNEIRERTLVQSPGLVTA